MKKPAAVPAALIAAASSRDGPVSIHVLTAKLGSEGRII